MRGFDDKALILFMKEDLYDVKSYEYKYKLRHAVTNLCLYLGMMDIEPHVFYTDDVARIIANPDFKYVSTLAQGDKFFLSRNVEGTSDALTRKLIEYPDIYNEILMKDPGSNDMTKDQRFEMVLRHDQKAAAKIIPKYKIVFHFLMKGNAKYKVTSKPGDGKIRANININTFTMQVLLGGIEEDPISILNVPYASRSLINWEVV